MYLAWCLHLVKKNKEALNWSRQALEQDPDNANGKAVSRLVEAALNTGESGNEPERAH